MKINKKNVKYSQLAKQLLSKAGKSAPLFMRKMDGLPELFSVRLINFPMDAITLHYWVNMPYCYNYWNMQGSTAKSLEAYYRAQMESDILFPFIISYGQLPIALIELYSVEKDVLANHIEARIADKGIHTLMAPPRYLLSKLPQKIKQLSRETLITALQFAFSFEGIDRVYTEPHIDNFHANELAKNMGFTFIKEISFPDKKANLFCFEKQLFLDTYPMH